MTRSASMTSFALFGATLAGLVRRLRLGLLLHATRSDRGTPRHTLEPDNPRAQIRHRLLQRGVLRQQAFGQGLKVATRQPGKGDFLWNRHARINSGPQRPDATSLGLIPARTFAPGTLRSCCRLIKLDYRFRTVFSRVQ